MLNSVVNKSCFRHLLDIITTLSVPTTQTTNLITSASFCFTVKAKMLWDEVTNSGKERLYCALLEGIRFWTWNF